MLAENVCEKCNEKHRSQGAKQIEQMYLNKLSRSNHMNTGFICQSERKAKRNIRPLLIRQVLLAGWICLYEYERKYIYKQYNDHYINLHITRNISYLLVLLLKKHPK